MSSILLTAQQSHNEHNMPNISEKNELYYHLASHVCLTHEEYRRPGPEYVDEVLGDDCGECEAAALLVQPRLAGDLVVVQLQVVEAVRSVGSPTAGPRHIVVRLGAGDAELLPLEVVLVEHGLLPALWARQSTALELLLDHVEGLHGSRVVVVVVELDSLLYSLMDEHIVWFPLRINVCNSG